jgi:hypothetical protein
MGGCFKNVLAGIGCLAVALIAAVAAWNYRAEIADVIRSVTGNEEVTSAEFTVGHPSEDALRSAVGKEESIARSGGPERIVLTADEMASLIQDRLDSRARMALDSISVILEPERFSLEADLLTDVFGRDLLGPLRGIIDPHEPIRVSGMAEVVAPGIVSWRIDEFVVSSFPFPGPTIPTLVNRLTGGSDGVILISVPATVGDIRVDPDGVTFYRRAD